MFGRVMASMLPYMPRGLVGRVAGRYIAGDSTRDAIALSSRLGASGYASTIDMLGEDSLDLRDAAAAAEGYLDLMGKMDEAGVERNISIKLTQLGLRAEEEAAFENLSRVLEGAAARDFFVRIDMEDSTVTDATLDFYRRARDIWPRVGTVLQSRLRRTPGDARALATGEGNFRLCKGIYPENDRIAHTDAEEIRISYLETLRILLEGGAYVALATHDVPMLDRARVLVEELGVDRSRYEFQALLGVPVGRTLDRLKEEGHTVRLYVPYGPEWYAYSLRRLRENPRMAGAIARGLFRRDRLRLDGREK